MTPARLVDTLAQVQHNRAAVNLALQLAELLVVESFGNSMMGAQDRLYGTRPTLCKLVLPSSARWGIRARAGRAARVGVARTWRSAARRLQLDGSNGTPWRWSQCWKCGVGVVFQFIQSSASTPKANYGVLTMRLVSAHGHVTGR